MCFFPPQLLLFLPLLLLEALHASLWRAPGAVFLQEPMVASAVAAAADASMRMFVFGLSLQGPLLPHYRGHTTH